jgi:hypothetical protein
LIKFALLRPRGDPPGQLAARSKGPTVRWQAVSEAEDLHVAFATPTLRIIEIARQDVVNGGTPPILTLVYPEQEFAYPSSLLRINGRDASHALTSSSVGVPRGDLLLLDDWRGSDDSLA